MKKYLACVLLCGAISLISFGIHIDNIILMGIGGAFVGVYITMISKKD